MIPWLLLAAGISLIRGSIVTVSTFTVVWCFPCVLVSVFQSLPVMTSSHWVKGYFLLCMTSCQQSCQTLSAYKTTLQGPGSYNFNIERKAYSSTPNNRVVLSFLGLVALLDLGVWALE